MNFLIPDKETKLTESEIMKALECCSKVLAESCAECPLQKADCLKVNIEELALDLINCKNAEIEELQHEKTELQHEIVSCRAEAIKEFAERVKAELTGWETDPTDEEIEFTIDQIAKEMGVE